MLSLKPKLKVAVFGKFDADSLGSNLAETLELNGHEALRVQVGSTYRHYRTKWLRKLDAIKVQAFEMLNRRKAVSCSIKKTVRRTDLVNCDLCIATNDVLLPMDVALLNDTLKCPVVMWFPDAVVNMGRSMFLNAPYHTVFIKDRFIVERLTKDFPKRRFCYLPECCNPIVHHPVEIDVSDVAKFGCDITTAGNCYANRVAFFEQLATQNLKIKIWGNLPSSWMDVRPIRTMLHSEFITGDEKAKAFQIAKVVLNNLHPGEIDSLNCRAFEIPACRGFQMVNHRDCIAELFQIDREIVTFASFHELQEKLDYYLANPEHRNAIAQAGFERVHRDHTYQQRLSVMVDRVLG